VREADAAAAGVAAANGHSDTKFGIKQQQQQQSAAAQHHQQYSQRYTPPAGNLDADTRLSARSFEVAVKAAGAVIEAVDRVSKQQMTYIRVLHRCMFCYCAATTCIDSSHM
jgi:acetoin utilization deacetylase AcuC-like enzyme